MKKVVVMLVMVLGLSTVSFGQSLLGKGSYEEPFRNDRGLVLPPHGEDGDQDADGPLGSGIAVLIGLGGAYMLAKKRNNK